MVPKRLPATNLHHVNNYVAIFVLSVHHFGMEGSALSRSKPKQKLKDPLDGSVVLFVPVQMWISTALLAAIFIVFILFAATKSYSRKEVVRGWIGWSSGPVQVASPANSLLTVVAVKQGDWVTKGQALAWAFETDAAKAIGVASNNFLINSPISGRITLVNAKQGMPVNSGRILFVIAPEDAKLQARLIVPSRAAGFVEIGQEVNLLLDAFPYQRFGVVAARIEGISETTVTPNQTDAPFSLQEAGYLVEADLQSVQVEGYGASVDIVDGMQFSANLIIDERNLVEWIMDPLFASDRPKNDR